MSSEAIKLEHITKVYKLYNRNRDRLKDSLGLTKKKCYTEHFALRDVSMEIHQGETVGIIGVNGSGKSTILKIITGVLSPTSGTMEINGRISALLELGAGFNMEYTGLENVYLNGTMLGFSEEEINDRLQAILDFADIGEFIHQPVKTYSSGMFVRLAFAVAINIDPEILIVDEALSVGDVFFQAKCYHKFEEFKKLGKTILFVSHDLTSIAKYCDRVVLLNKGVKLAEGSPRDMVNMYKKLLVHQLDEDTLEDVNGKSAINEHVEDGKAWKEHFEINPKLLDYGEKQAEIVDFCIIDQYGQYSSIIEKGSTCQIKAKLYFHEQVKNPIFTLTIRHKQGTDITGTNTMFEGTDIKPVKAGDEYEVSFTQKMPLQGGEYLLSMSCTGFEQGEHTEYHRLYEVANITVISNKNTVCVYDMESAVQAVKIERNHD